MPREKFTNALATTLNGAINNSTTTVVVTDASTFPASGYFRILVENEMMLVTARSSNTLTVIRGQELTTAVSHSSGVAVNHIMTAAMLDNFRLNLLAEMGKVPDSTSLSADDDEFDDESFSGSWTQVYVTGKAPVITEVNHQCSIQLPGTGSNSAKPHGFMKAKSPSAGDWVQAGVSFGGAGSALYLFGVCMTDGATYGSGKQMMWWYNTVTRTAMLEAWTTWSSAPGISSATPSNYPTLCGTIHMRLVFESTNHYSAYMSPDGISWAKLLDNVSLGTVGTITHMGFVCDNWDSPNQAVANFNYCRFSF